MLPVVVLEAREGAFLVGRAPVSEYITVTATEKLDWRGRVTERSVVTRINRYY